MSFLERMSGKLERGARGFIQSPFLLLGLMVLGVLIKVFIVPDPEDPEG